MLKKIVSYKVERKETQNKRTVVPEKYIQIYKKVMNTSVR